MIAMLSILPVVAGLVTWQLPLMAAPQSAVPDSAGVEVKTGYFKVLHRTPVSYPVTAQDTGEEGAVVVSVTVNDSGEVTDARVVSSTGPDELKRAVLSSVLQWHFSVEPVEVAPGDRRPVPSTFEIAVGFKPTGVSQRRQSLPAMPETDRLLVLQHIDMSLVPAEVQAKLEPALTVRAGQTVRAEELTEQVEIARKLDSHLRAIVTKPGGPNNDAVTLIFMLPAATGRTAPPPPPPAPADGLSPPQRIRVGGNTQAMNLISKVTPVYPPLAKQARIQGVVSFTATIGKDGYIENLQLISGHPLLAEAASEAVRQWVYRPTLLNGAPVSVITQIDVNFTLANPQPAPQQ
jgi:TonB family protein